jgi:hypothetical protein
MHSEITATANIASFSSVVREWGKQTGHHLLRPVQILKRYRRVDRRPDLVAGLTVAVVMLPQAIAYALIAELPPQVGLYAAIVTAIVGALWGRRPICTAAPPMRHRCRRWHRCRSPILKW